MRKRILSILLAAIMIVSLLPATAWAGTPSGTALTANGGTLTEGSYYLNTDITLTSNLTVSGEVTLDLNGHVLKGNESGSVITVNSGAMLTLEDSNPTAVHKFTVNSETGLWTLAENAIENYQTVPGGVITGDNANGLGGGVYVSAGGTFNMNGGNIIGNKAKSGGGVYEADGGTFNMAGGSIVGNTASDTVGGGGVHIIGTFNMYDGHINNNTAGVIGGVSVVKSGIFNMTGGEIRGNKATNDKGFGGVSMSGGVTLGGTAQITGNTAGDNTRNLYLANDKTVTLASASNAPADGFSVGVTTQTAPTTENLVQITPTGTADDVKYFFSDNPVYSVTYNSDKKLALIKNWPELQKALNGTHEATVPGLFEIKNDGTIKLLTDFKADTDDITLTVAGIKILDLNGFILDRGLSDKDAVNGGNVITVTSGGILTIKDSSKGKTGEITGGNNTDIGGGIIVGEDAVFNMDGGSIKGNKAAQYGGGLLVAKGAKVKIENAKIAQNTVVGDNGGGIFVYAENCAELNENEKNGTVTGGTVVLTDTEVSENGAKYGGGIFIKCGSVTVDNCQIKNNTAEYGGGGVEIESAVSSFTMSGGAITGNTVKEVDSSHHKGAGVHFNLGTFVVKGTVDITGNKCPKDSTQESNVYLRGTTPQTFTVSEMNTGSKIGVYAAVVEENKNTNSVKITSDGALKQAACFSSDFDDYCVRYNSDHFELVKVAEVNNITDWNALNTAISTADGPTTIKLTENIAAPSGASTITIPANKDITIDLNGKVLNASGGAFSVITVTSGGILTIKDSNPTETHYFTKDTTTGLWTLAADQETPTEYVVTGGVITGGTGEDYGNGTNGGGVTVHGTFNMFAGNIIGNKVKKAASGILNGCGGGVSVDNGTFTMSGGTISGNTANGAGGGVNVTNTGTFTMTGGTISGNTAECGGGIQSDSTLKLLAAAGKTITITGNTAVKAEGVVNWENMSLSGNVIIKDNICTATYGAVNYPKDLATYYPITIEGALTGSDIYITHVSEDDTHNAGVLTSGFATKNEGAKLGDFFHYDGPANFEMVLNESGDNAGELEVKGILDVVKIGEAYYQTLADAIAEAQDGSTITLLKNNSETITINKAITFSIDANDKEFTPINIIAGEGFVRIKETADKVTTYKFIEGQGNVPADPVEVNDDKIISSGSAITVKDENGEAVANENLAAVAKKINEVLDNDKVNNFGQLTDEDETRLIAATEARTSAIAEALKAKTDDPVAKGNVAETNISKYLNVKLVSADVDINQTAGTTVTVNKLVFDVTPMATITVTGTEGTSVTLTTKITNDNIKEDVTFLLPVDKENTALTAAVYHENEFIDNYPINADGADKYITVTTAAFSKFGYITLDASTAGAEIDGTYYASLSDAVAKVADDQTIKLLKDASGAITVSRAVKFTVNDNEKTNTAEIAAGSGYVISQSGSTYTVSAYSGGGGGASSYAVEIPANVKNGKVEVSPKNASAGQTVTLTVTPDKGFMLETLTVLDKNGKEIEVKNLGNNKYNFKMPNGKVSISATFMEDNTMLNFCVDVKASDYYYDAVLWAYENEICKGTDAVHFSPNAPVSRAQVVTFLWRAAGCPVVNYAMNMSDVKSGEYYSEAVRWALSEGITKGTSATTFDPDAICTRGQIVTFLARFAGVEDADTASAFTDVKTTDYFAAAVKWAKDNKVTEGTSATTFSPNDDCTRAQVVTFLYRWMVK